MPEIPRSYCVAKLRSFGKSSGKDSIDEFKLAVNSFADRLADLSSKRCEERKKKVISADDVIVALALIK